MTSSPKPKLYTVIVPWSINSWPEIELTVYESTEATVSFLANFLSDSDDVLYKVQEVIVRFKVTGLTKTSHAYFGSAPNDNQDIKLYDWSEIAHSHYEPLGDIGAYEKHLDEEIDKWRKTGICPFPGVYEIRESPWSESKLAKNLDLKHYMFVGEDLKVEILGRDWSWEVADSD